MRKCPRCKIAKPLVAFSAKGDRGFQPYCKPCNAEQKREWYQRNKVKVIAASRTRKHREVERKRSWIAAYLSQHPCVDCGESDLIVLEFDHLCDKTDNISRLIQDGAQVRLEAEIQKCEVVCANCHRRRTARQYNSWRLRGGRLVDQDARFSPS